MIRNNTNTRTIAHAGGVICSLELGAGSGVLFGRSLLLWCAVGMLSDYTQEHFANDEGGELGIY